MRVAFDEQIFAIQPYGGISRMFTELARQFITDPGVDVELLPLNAPVINRYILDQGDVRTRLAVWDAHHEYHSLARYFMRVRPRRGQDIVHNTFYLPHGLARYPGAKRVVTIHDMIPELLPHTRRRLDFLTLKHRYVQQADHIICVSEATRNDLLTVYPEIKAPITVVHHGVDSRFTSTAPRLPDLPERYILFVGNRSHYKDADVLFRAFATMAVDFPAHNVVLVGGGKLSPEETVRLRELNIRERVHHVELTDPDVVCAYAHAEIFVFPSRFEGFGMPVLEAMACGVPVLLANATSLPEVGGDAARYFRPGDSEELATAMRILLEDPTLRERMREAGIARAAQFTWQRAATAHAEVYTSTLSA